MCKQGLPQPPNYRSAYVSTKFKFTLPICGPSLRSGPELSHNAHNHSWLVTGARYWNGSSVNKRRENRCVRLRFCLKAVVTSAWTNLDACTNSCSVSGMVTGAITMPVPTKIISHAHSATLSWSAVLTAFHPTSHCHYLRIFVRPLRWTDPFQTLSPPIHVRVYSAARLLSNLLCANVRPVFFHVWHPFFPSWFQSNCAIFGH